MPKNIFDNYANEVKAIFDGDLTKTLAISLSEAPPAQFDGVSVVNTLYKSLACDGWKTSTGTNWMWRTEESDYQTSSPEVALEREIVASDEKNQWTFQMSTASGIQGGYFHKRRSIDLVKRTAPSRYAFVELKVGSNNPLSAAFEILSYALAYVHARRHNWQGIGSYNVMQAQVIHLIVLGTSEWYRYKKRGAHAQQHKFNFDWLGNALENGLNSLTDRSPQLCFSFEEYRDEGDPSLTATGIVRDALRW